MPSPHEMASLSIQQNAICQKYGATPFATPNNLKVGIAHKVRGKLLPINGLRVLPQGDTSGWYIWAGSEFSNDANFFVPLHVEHLADWCPEALPYLLLPPGWRFLVAPNYEDVWFDDALLKEDR